jgi:AcrR family transcriptional regulator
MLSERRSAEIHVAEVAEAAYVGVQTIYYHFGNRNRLIAEAQAATYFHLSEPLHDFLVIAEAAVIEDDEETFWRAVGDDVAMAWSYEFGDDKWRISKLLIDIWDDPKTQLAVSELLNVQFERWVKVMNAAKLCGWTDPDLDTYALIASCWAASNGQAIFANASRFNYTPESIRNFYLGIAMVKR